MPVLVLVDLRAPSDKSDHNIVLQKLELVTQIKGTR